MKIALCLSGLIGNAEKWLNGAELDYKYGHKYLKESILEGYDVDVFIHSYSTKHEDGLKKIYNPVKSVFEQNPQFKLRGDIDKKDLPTPYAYCLKSMWYSRKRSVELVAEYEAEKNFKYDFVLLTRFDIALFKKFKYEEYDKTKLYIAGPILANRLPSGHIIPDKINDMYFMSDSNTLLKVVNVSDEYENIAIAMNSKWPMESVSSHRVITEHFLNLNLFEKTECLFERPWQSSRAWSGDIRFLRSDPDVKLLLDK